MNEEQLRANLKRDPADESFLELMKLLLEKQEHTEAIVVALQALSKNPSHGAGRLELARAYYLAGYYPFAVRELKDLYQLFPENEALRRLLEKLSPGATAGASKDNIADSKKDAEGETVSEAEFDFDDIDLLDD